MPEINVLPPEIFNRIAAGEVVERPASVVKELVENAIDAGATSIRVRIERAGTKLVQVSDNGRGMDAEDALLSIQPHSTSKIRTVEDISHITTLGFRGEALPSIASVSRFQIRTRKRDADAGFELTYEGGKVAHTGPAGCPAGTEVSVRELFFNTPARRKFLRSFATEESCIEEVLIASALGNLNISFELVSDGRQSFFSAAATGLEPRLRDFFGKRFSENMLAVEAVCGTVKVSGVTARPGLTRTSRREQRSFVNGRPVEAAAIYRGIRDGYGALNEKGRYSPCVLFIEMPDGDLDINVHPAKREVRFRQEYNVSRAVTAAVAGALRRAPSPVSTLDADVSLDAILRDAGIGYTISQREQPVFESHYPEHSQEDAPPFEFAAAPTPPRQTTPAEVPPPQAPEPPPAPLAPPPQSEAAPPGAEPPEHTLIGAVDDTYIVLFNPVRRSLEIVDQHAAHERVLYERLLSAAREKKTAMQPLLLPRTVEPGRPAAGWLAKNAELLAGLGFEISELSSNTLMLNAVPAILPESEWDRVLSEIYLASREEDNADHDLLSRMARAACHAAVKAHDKLTPDEVSGLLRQLARCERPDICPHGRPTAIEITSSELEKRFGRKQ